VALDTGYVFVTAVEFESGRVMIELNRLPPFKTMATGAGSIFLSIKLFVMLVRMAIQTPVGQAGETLHNRSIRIGFEMALFAIGLCMPAGEFETGRVVIKFHPAPGDHVMTVFAVLISEVFYIDIFLMDIFMTIGASLFQILEHPFRSLLMA
jgi:hypothetical protein